MGRQCITLPTMAWQGWIAAILLLLGIVLTWLGLRGRRVDDHPVCRKCGRDLYGLDAESRVCPECGCYLFPDRIRTGNRVRRFRLVGVGATLATLALLAVAPLAMSLVLGAEGERLKPTWLLLWESRTSASAVEEIDRREMAGALDAGEVDRVVARWLDDQGDANRPWLFEKGDFLFRLAATGRLTPAQEQRLVEQAVAPTLEVDPLVPIGEPLPIWESGETRGAAGKMNLSRMQSAWVPVNLVLVRDGQSFATMYLSASVLPGVTAHHAMELPDLPPGEYGLAIEPAVARPPRRPAAPIARPASGLWPLFDVTIVPAEKPVVEIVDDPAALARVRRELTLQPATMNARHKDQRPGILVTYQSRWDKRSEATGPHHWSLGYDMTSLLKDAPLPYALAYEVFLRDEHGHEWAVGTHTLRAGLWGPRSHGNGGELPAEFDADVVDVILRPSVAVAEETPHATRILGGEVVIENVEVVWQNRPAPPTTATDPASDTPRQ